MLLADYDDFTMLIDVFPIELEGGSVSSVRAIRSDEVKLTLSYLGTAVVSNHLVSPLQYYSSRDPARHDTYLLQAICHGFGQPAAASLSH